MPTNAYESPLSSRYASDEMLYLFSAGQEILHLAPSVGGAGPGGDGAGPAR